MTAPETEHPRHQLNDQLTHPVRFSLVARAMREDERGVFLSSRPSLENHSPTDPEDGYYRQVLTTSVTARNLRMMHTP